MAYSLECKIWRKIVDGWKNVCIRFLQWIHIEGLHRASRIVWKKGFILFDLSLTPFSSVIIRVKIQTAR